MKETLLNPSRRGFLCAGLAAPAIASAASAADLRYRVLGRTGLKVSTVSFGCLITTDPSVISRAIDLGINYLDTAREYQNGNNEYMVGAALGNRRKDVIVSTKTDPQHTLDRKGALSELEASLKGLRTDHVDIWYLHSKDDPEKITDDLLEAQRQALQQGKIRFRGVSTHRVARMTPRILQVKTFDVVMATYNFSMVDTETDAALETLHKANTGLVAMKVMAGGAPGRNTNPKLGSQGAPLAALKWVVSNPNITTTVPSMSDTEQVEENLRATREPLTTRERSLLTARLEEIRPLYCRMCGRCDGQCPKGLPVSDVLRFLMYAEGYGQFALGRESFRALPGRLAATRCADCSRCAIRCPNGVRVRQRLIRAQEIFA